MPSVISSSVTPLNGNHDFYDNFISDAVTAAVLTNNDITQALLKANANNPNRLQQSYHKDVLNDLPQYIPTAVQTYRPIAPNPYVGIQTAVDYLEDTYLLVGRPIDVLYSSPTLEEGAISTGQPDKRVQQSVYYRTLSPPYGYSAVDYNDPSGRGNPNITTPAVLDWVRIRKHISPQEYAKHFVYRYRDFNGYGYFDTDWYYDASTNQAIVRNPINFDGSRVTINITGYSPTALYTYIEYLQYNGQTGIYNRKVFLYQYSDVREEVNINEPDSILEAFLRFDPSTVANDNPVSGDFYPIIPMRRNNTEIEIPELNKLLDRKYKIDLPGILTNIKESRYGNVADIDDCYMIHGIPLNSRKDSHKRYLFEFFKTYIASIIDNPRNPYYQPPSQRTLNLSISGSGMHINLRGGTFREYTEQQTNTELNIVSIVTDTSNNIWLRRTMSKTETEVIYVANLTHHNLIDDREVIIGAHLALTDLSYDEFMIPIHDPTLQALNNKDKISISGSNLYLVFNYIREAQRKTFWESFLEFFAAVAVVASIIFPFVAPQAVGLLGASATVGASLGFAGTTAIIIGASANIIAAVLLAKLITEASTGIFGEKDGEIIGAILSSIATLGISGLHSGGGLASAWKDLNLITKGTTVTNALSTVQQTITKQQTEKLKEESEILNKTTQTALDEIEEKSKIFETPNTFLTRTRLTGTSFTSLTTRTVSDFTKNSLRLQRFG